jgi:hypothetical protein
VKTLAALLVVANLVAFAWWQGMLDRWVPGSREPQRLQGQIAPDKLKLVPLERLERAEAAKGAADTARCVEVGPLDDGAFARVAEWVATLGERARGEAAPPLYRVRFAESLAPADLLAYRAELAARAGREPGGCASTGAQRMP